MPLFGRRRGGAGGPATEHVPGLGAEMRRRGWQPAPERPFDGDLEQLCTRVALAMHRSTRNPLRPGPGPDVQGANFRDAYRGVVDGRTVVVANAWLRIHEAVLISLQEFHGTSVCAVELAATIVPACIQPRTLRAAFRFPEAPTGAADFDARYAVLAGTDAPPWLTPDVRRLILARDDWVFLGVGVWLGCVGRGAFDQVGQVRERIDEVLAVVRAIPTSVLPDHIDRSVDDLLDRIAAIDDIAGAMAFLQSLSDADRQRLADSDTPLAAMADAHTPDQAMQRLQTMPPDQVAQLMAMFARRR